MHRRYDDFEEFDDFDFADTMTVNRIMRMERRDSRRLGPRRGRGFREEDYADERYVDFEEDPDYADYDADEFDSFQGFGTTQ